MKLYITTSDDRNFLLEGFNILLERHWDKNLDITVLCYNKPDIELPTNYKIISLGKQKDYGKYWSNALREFFTSIDDDYFFLCMEDHFLINDIDLEVLEEAKNQMKNNTDKVFLEHYDIGDPIYNNYFYRSITNKDIGSSLLPSIWKRSFFLELLRENLTCWEFEIKNLHSYSENIILYPRRKPIFRSLDAYRQGRFWNKVFGPHKLIKNSITRDIDLKVFKDMKRKSKCK